MERDRHDPRIVGVDRLDTVPVVDVEVDVQHPLALEAGERDGQRRIVVDAEPRGAIAHRVMEAPAGMEGVLDLARDDRPHRRQRPARN